jgi:alkylhydroperoxidase family enzyme
MTRSGRRAGLVDGELDAIGSATAERETFDPREALILEVAAALTQDPDGVTEDMRARLSAQFAPAEIVNILMAIGLYNLTSRLLKSMQIRVEDVLLAGAEPSTGESL